MLELEKVAKNYRKDYVLGFIESAVVMAKVDLEHMLVNDAKKSLDRIVSALKELRDIEHE